MSEQETLSKRQQSNSEPSQGSQISVNVMIVIHQTNRLTVSIIFILFYLKLYI